ncbi:MAG: hypothetical protein JW915_19105 [Chitinispirillaceae bacterium]|nr:hypothetical protein [Chitinispirillaceae bacterium]
MRKNTSLCTIKKVLFVCILSIFHFKTSIRSEEPAAVEYDWLSQISISMETKAGYDFTNKFPYGENELIVEKRFSTVDALSAVVENLLSYDDGTFTDEITVGAIGVPLRFLSVCAACKFFIIKDDIGFGIDGKIVIGHDFQTVGFNFEDENEFLYDITGKRFEYVNTFYAEKSFNVTANTSVGILLEHEVTISECDFESLLLMGPMYSIKCFSLYVNYAVGIKPCITHGTELGCVFGF